jgi:hypothetical protein
LGPKSITGGKDEKTASGSISLDPTGHHARQESSARPGRFIRGTPSPKFDPIRTTGRLKKQPAIRVGCHLFDLTRASQYLDSGRFCSVLLMPSDGATKKHLSFFENSPIKLKKTANVMP